MLTALFDQNILVSEDPTVCAYRDKEDIWFTQNYAVQITDFGIVVALPSVLMCADRACSSPADHSRIFLQDGSVVCNHKDNFHQMFLWDTDLKKISMELHSLKIANWGLHECHEKTLYRDFKKSLINGRCTVVLSSSSSVLLIVL